MGTLTLCVGLAALLANDSTVAADLTLPPISRGEPAAGRRVIQTPPEYADSDVYHTVYLPPDWSPDGRDYPVIVEYTGNYFPTSGSSGRVDDAALGYGLTGGKFIWVVLPFVGADGQSNAVRWWGDEERTIAYAKTNVPRICEQFGGDPKSVVLCGFSRGAIAVNYIGLADDDIAKLWCGLVTSDHYDGVRAWNGTTWGAPLDRYRRDAAIRLDRVGKRPRLICQNGGTAATRRFLKSVDHLDGATFLDLNVRELLGTFPNDVAVHPHTDRWPLVPSASRDIATNWLAKTIAASRASSNQEKPPHGR